MKNLFCKTIIKTDLAPPEKPLHQKATDGAEAIAPITSQKNPSKHYENSYEKLWQFLWYWKFSIINRLIKIQLRQRLMYITIFIEIIIFFWIIRHLCLLNYKWERLKTIKYSAETPPILPRGSYIKKFFQAGAVFLLKSTNKTLQRQIKDLYKWCR